MTELAHRISIRDTLAQMEVGDTVGLAFDVAKGASIRSAASILGLEMERTYTVHVNRNNRTYEVTRNE